MTDLASLVEGGWEPFTDYFSYTALGVVQVLSPPDIKVGYIYLYKLISVNNNDNATNQVKIILKAGEQAVTLYTQAGVAAGSPVVWMPDLFVTDRQKLEVEFNTLTVGDRLEGIVSGVRRRLK